MPQFFENFTILSLITTLKNITITLGAHMRPYSHMYCTPSRDGVLQLIKFCGKFCCFHRLYILKLGFSTSMKKSIGIQSFSAEKGQKQKALPISQGFRNFATLAKFSLPLRNFAGWEFSQPANLPAIPVDFLTSFLVSPHFVPMLLFNFV